MRSFLNITRHPYEEPYHVQLFISAGNPSIQGNIEIYANASDLTIVANGLAGFPKDDNDSFLWELGSENKQDRFAFYFRLRVFQVSRLGRCAVELRFNNNETAPHQQIVEFCIDATPADVDRLGRAFRQFSRLEDLAMEWDVAPGI